MFGAQKREINSGARWFEVLELPVRLKEALRKEADALDAQESAEAQDAKAARIERGVQAELALDAAAAGAAAAAACSFGSPDMAGRGPLVQLFEAGVVEAAYKKVESVGVGDKAWQTQRSKVMKHIVARGPVRRQHRRHDWSKALTALRASHSNFSPVLDLIEEELVLAGDKRPLVLPPLLMNGPPGCGKTFFAQHLAGFFQTGFVRVSMETAQTSAELSGTAAHWGNTKPGRLFDRLVDGDYANPVFLIDEVDKAGGYESHRSDKALYGLLERNSARQWSDASLPDLVMDVSHVIWLLTSNEARRIPAPLRSRMVQFDIQPLDAHAARQLVRTLYRDEVRRHKHLRLDPELPIAHCDVLRCHSPRVIARLAHSLVARLAKERRQQVTLDDLQATGALGDWIVKFERHFDRYCTGSKQ